jgi:hypothetical protein
MNRTATQEATMDLTTATPAEVDAVLFPLLEKLAHVEHAITEYRWLLGEVGRPPRGGLLSRRNVRENGLEYHDPGTQRDGFERSRDGKIVEKEELDAEVAPLEAEFDRRPWTRYIVVPGGHLHVRTCHTLTPGRTMVGQVAEASGLTPDEVVAKYDETACTHCFPDAPVADKKTPAEEGFCEHSGEYVADRLVEAGKLDAGWFNRYVKPRVRCECGWAGAITAGGKLRKHKAPES